MCAVCTDGIGLALNGLYLDAIITTEVGKDVFKLARRAIFENNKVFSIDDNKKLKINAKTRLIDLWGITS